MCFVRASVNLLVAIFTVTVNKKHIFNDLPDKYRKLVLIRSCMGLIGFTSVVFSLKMIPVFIVQTINNTNPFWIGIMGYYFLGDAVKKRDLCFMMGTFVGVCVLVLSKATSVAKEEENNQNENSNEYLIGIMCALVAALGFSGISIITRKIKEVHFSIMMFWYGIFAASMYFLGLVLEYNIIGRNYADQSCQSFRLLCYDSHQWKLMLSAAFCNAVSMNCSTIAF